MVTEHDGNHLFWCKHHFEHLEELIGLFVVTDTRESINRKPGGSA